MSNPPDRTPAPPLQCIQASLARVQTLFLSRQDLTSAQHVLQLLLMLVEHPQVAHHRGLLGTYRGLVEYWADVVGQLEQVANVHGPALPGRARVH